MTKIRTDNSESPHVKRAYQTPAIEESGSFERLVLSCLHTDLDEQLGSQDCVYTPVITVNS